MKSIAEKSLEMTSLFEAELLVRLMLRNWQHPLADDLEYGNALLEAAAEALRSAAQGEQLIEGVPAASINLVAAVWYAESCALQPGDADPETVQARENWLIAVRRALPSCFCDPDLLPE